MFEDIFRLVLLYSVSYIFFLYRSPLLCAVFDTISSEIDDFLSVITCA